MPLPIQPAENKISWFKAESVSIILALLTLNAFELLRYFSFDYVDPFPFLIVVLVYASFTSYGLITLIITLLYLIDYFFTNNLPSHSFFAYLIVFPFLTILDNLIKFSLQEKFNPTVALNFEKFRSRQEFEKTKREFISMAAHQLKTPLGGMRWNLEMLLGNKSTVLNQSVKATLTEVYASNLKMISLVNNLLEINKLVNNKNSLPTEAVDLKLTIQNLLNDTKYLTHQNQIDLILEAEPDLPKVYLDPKAFHEVLLNLVANAIKYNRDRGKVVVKTRLTGSEVIISVTDTGIGISQEENKKIFERFYRSPKAIEKSSEGSGLGLYLVKLIVESWHGKIWFTSAVNQGTTFSFTIPLVK